MIKPLIEFKETLKPYCSKSPTLKVLFDQCVKLGITLHSIEDPNNLPEEIGDICGTDWEDFFNNQPTMDDITVLAHEMAHATSCGPMQFVSDYWAEKYAYTTMKLVMMELEKAGYEFDFERWIPTEEELLEMHPDEAYDKNTSP